MQALKKAFAALGVLTMGCASVSPLTSYAADQTQNSTDITVHVQGSIQLVIENSSVNTLNINTNDINTNTMHTDISVSANGYNSYRVTVEDEDEETALVHTTAASNKIPANASLSAGTSAWAVKVNDDGQWMAMVPKNAPSPIAVVSGTGATTSTATVHYGVSTSATQLGGEYKDTIVYTAIAD